MISLEKVVRTYSAEGVLLISDFNIGIIAKEILKSIKIFKSYNSNRSLNYDDYYYMSIKESFELDIAHNNFHMILWENWMSFLADLELITIEIRWEWPTELLFTDEDIKYLEDMTGGN